MKRLLPIILTACILTVFLFTSCGEMGDPAPNLKIGLMEDGSKRVVLFANGSIYNFDYTYQYDGIQLIGYTNKRPEHYSAKDPEGNYIITGNIFTKIGSEDMGVTGGRGIAMGTPDDTALWPQAITASNSVKSLYSEAGGRSLLFMHEQPYNCDPHDNELWRITLFDDPPLYVNRDDHFAGSKSYKEVTFFARRSEQGSRTTARVTLTIIGSSGYVLGTQTFNMAGANTGLWYQFTVPINKYITISTLLDPNDPNSSIEMEVPVDSNERVRQWEISVEKNAGRVYVDEVVLQ